MDLYNRVRPKSIEEMWPTSKELASLPMRVQASLSAQRGEIAEDSQSVLPHCMLLCADHPGVGKTTTARLLAIEMNPHLSPDEKDAILNGKGSQICFEINGADFRKIDDARDMAQQIYSLNETLYDYNFFFIVNEIHQLTDAAMELINAPLENIPKRVYFIGTTTDVELMTQFDNGKPRKSGKALLSRFQRYHYNRLEEPDMVQYLSGVCSKLGYTAPRHDILKRIHHLSEGTLRLSLQFLDAYLNGSSLDDVFVSGMDSGGADAKEVIECLEARVTVPEPSQKPNWYGRVGPALKRMMREKSADEARVVLVKELFDRINEYNKDRYKDYSPQQIKAVMSMYAELGELLEQPISHPFMATFMSRMFRFVQTH